MLHYIDIAGVKYPVYFGWNALRLFTLEYELTLSDLNNLGNSLSIDKGFSLALLGLKDGARIEAKQESKINTYNWSIEDIGDLQDKDGKTLDKIMSVFAKCMAKIEADAKKDAKKK